MENNINKVTCKFENKVLEDSFLNEKWLKVRNFYKIMLIGFIIFNFLGIFSLWMQSELKFETIFFYIPNLMLSFIFLLSGEKFRKQYIEIAFTLLFSLVIPTWHFLDFERLSNLPHIPVMPIIVPVFMLYLFPFNFLSSFAASSIGFVSSLTLIQNFSSITPPIFGVIYISPYLILIVNKLKSEIESRNDYLKGVTINETKKLMQKTLKRYFGDVLSEKILNSDGVLIGETKWVTICFTDISSYSTIVEYMSPEVAVEFLYEYFNEMHKIIEKHNGQILNYIGDSIMIVFGAPNNLKNHEEIAVKCAIDMKNKLKELNQNWIKNQLARYWKNHGIEKISVRIGIHTGNVIAGNIGSENMLQYSTIGDVVNVASRLEKANKDFNTEISFSHEIYTALTEDLYGKSKLSGEITLKGRTAPTKVYSV